MKDFWSKVLVSLVSAAIIGNTVLLLDLRDRVSRMEAAFTLQRQVRK